METQNARPRIRNPIACEKCKMKKARCNPSEVEGTCQKCLKSGTRCVPSERHPRPRKERISKTSGRVAELEKNLDGLLGSIESRSTPIQADNEQRPLGVVTEASPDPEEEDDTEVLIEIHKHAFPGGIKPTGQSDDEYGTTAQSSPWTHASVTTPGSSAGSAPKISRTTNHNFQDSKECEKLLASFREMVKFFPFFIIPENVDRESLPLEKPFLFLAMMAAASFSYAKHQTLDTQFRQALSTKVIMGRQKSVEIVQGLLVYLAWYPYHLNPRNAQTFQFLQIALSMCHDLGMDRQSQSSDQPENRRAYLGCYYLSTAFSTIFKKPNNIEFTEYTKYCCNCFTTSPEYPSDILLPWLIEACHETDVFTKFPLTTTISLEPPPNLSQSTAGTNNRHSNLASKINPLTLMTQTFDPVYQSSLLGPGIGAASKGIATTVPASIRLQNLRACITHCTNFLDTILSFPVDTYRYFTIIQWSQLIHTIATLMNLSFPIHGLEVLDGDGWDGEVARSNGRLGIYLESLCWRMSVLSREPGGKGSGTERSANVAGPGSRNHFAIMRTVLEYVKSSYDQRVERLTSTSPSPSTRQEKGNLNEEERPAVPQRASETRRNHKILPAFKVTKCPMLNGALRSMPTTSSMMSTTDPSSVDTYSNPPSRLPLPTTDATTSVTTSDESRFDTNFPDSWEFPLSNQLPLEDDFASWPWDSVDIPNIEMDWSQSGSWG